MGEILLKIFGHIIGILVLLGIIGFFIWMIQYAWYAAQGRISIIFPFWFVVTDKSKNPKEVRCSDYDPMKVGIRVVPHPKPKKAKKPKPEWWRFLTEESIGSLLEKRRQKKTEAEARKNDPWSSR